MNYLNIKKLRFLKVLQTVFKTLGYGEKLKSQGKINSLKNKITVPPEL